MAQTSTTYKNAIEFLQDVPSDFPSRIGKEMSSSEMNGIGKKIEGMLNTLYEKIRILEDVKEYGIDFVISEIEKKEREFREKLKIIEENADAYRDKAAISLNVSLTAEDRKVYDRDGKEIEKMKKEKESLCMPGTMIEQGVLASIIHRSDNACYNNTYDNLIYGMAGHSVYYSSDPAPGGVQEQCSVILKEPLECNTVHISTANAKLENVCLLTEEGQSTLSSGNCCFSKQKITGISFLLRAKDYTSDKISKSVNTDTTFLTNLQTVQTGNTIRLSEKSANDLAMQQETTVFQSAYNALVKGRNV